MVFHAGKSLEAGHYYCCARSETSNGDDVWYMFNDSHVSRMSFADVQGVQAKFPNDTAYMLFYTRIAGAEDISGKGGEALQLHPRVQEMLTRDQVAFLKDLEREAHMQGAAAAHDKAHWTF